MGKLEIALQGTQQSGHQGIEIAAQALSITIHDHLIIGKSAEFSFKSAGYLSG